MKSYAAIYRVTLALVLFLQFQVVAAPINQNDRDATKTVIASGVNFSNRMGSWIWRDTTTRKQSCQLWKSFEITSASPVRNATLWITADDACSAYIDGRQLGSCDGWHSLFIFDVTSLLYSGKHVLAVDAYNLIREAGMVAGLQIVYANGEVTNIVSDKSWRIVPEGSKRWQNRSKPEANWPEATVVAPFGSRWWSVPDDIITKPLFPMPKLAFWERSWFQTATWSVCAAIFLFSLRLLGQLSLHRKEEWLLKQERTRIAREIHDNIGAGMTQLVLNGEVAQRNSPPGSKAHPQLIKICSESRRLLASMDEILWAINPQCDTLQEFVAYICKYAEEFLKPTPIQCFFDVTSEIKSAAFNLPLRRSLLAAVKEALKNAVKHSKATELHLAVRCEGQELCIVIQDNGMGFDMAGIKAEKNGLINLSQRVKHLGGHMTVKSEPGKGCRIEFSIPLGPQRRKFAFWPGQKNK